MGNIIYATLPFLIHMLELIGIFIIMAGSVHCFYDYLKSLINKTQPPIKVNLLSSLELGLGYKLGAEILKTVLVQELQELLILGAIVILRALMSLLIHYERSTEIVAHKPADS